MRTDVHGQLVLAGHAVGTPDGRGLDNRSIGLLIVGERLTNGDQDRATARARSPQIIAVVAADHGRQVVLRAEKADGARFAVVGREDAGLRALRRGQTGNIPPRPWPS